MGFFFPKNHGSLGYSYFIIKSLAEVQAMFTLYRIGFCSVSKVAPIQCEQATDGKLSTNFVHLITQAYYNDMTAFCSLSLDLLATWCNKLKTHLQKFVVLRHSTQLNDSSPKNRQPWLHCRFQTSTVSATAPLRFLRMAKISAIFDCLKKFQTFKNIDVLCYHFDQSAQFKTCKVGFLTT